MVKWKIFECHAELLRFDEWSGKFGEKVQQTLKYIFSVSQEIFLNSKALLFGSQATGLALLILT
jgi:hypothetical protein